MIITAYGDRLPIYDHDNLIKNTYIELTNVVYPIFLFTLLSGVNYPRQEDLKVLWQRDIKNSFFKYYKLLLV